jgi:DNA-binding winged helix-turn-helix (wHTH) protein/Tol biopolymer transport system component
VAARVFEFGTFRLDCDRFELSSAGRSLKLERKPMELLILLAARNGQLVTRAEIAQHLWGSEVFVDTEHGINTAVRKIRQALGDDPETPRFVQTVTGKGYRFSAPLAPIAPVASFAPAEEQPKTPIAVPPVRRQKPVGLFVALAVCALIAIAGIAFYRTRYHPPEIRYTQLTDFTDSAVSPALSPDGRMLAFIRGSDPFLSSNQIYLKMLPNGETRKLTDDSRPKYGPAFSPDGAEIAYSVLDPPSFNTNIVSVLGGESRLLLKNAAGLSWLDPNQLLFSEIRSGIHLGLVTATPTRSGLRDIYFPAHERGMAHYSYPSPDHQRALVVEMNGNGDWAPCRLVSLNGPSESRTVGPGGACTSAGWSPDGSWMYFTAYVEGRCHLWRQRYPEGSPEQITRGPMEEDGIAVEPIGNSVITSVGVQQSAIWIHDDRGEHPLSSEGNVLAVWSPPEFSPDDSILYFLLRDGRDDAPAELWRTTVQSGKSEPVLPGISMLSFDISPDGRQVVYAATNSSGASQIWVAPVDRSSASTTAGSSGGTSPHFGAQGQILFKQSEGNSNYLEQMNPDGSGRFRVVPYPISEIQGVSPGRRWVMAMVPNSPQAGGPGPVAIPINGGQPRPVCVGVCVPIWASDGKYLYIPVEPATRTSTGRSLAIPVGPGEALPDFPPSGIPPLAQPSIVKGSQSIPRESLIPGKDPSHYAYVNTTVHRNLYRLSLH